MKRYLPILILSLLSMIAVPSFSETVNELPMSQEKYDSLSDRAKTYINDSKSFCKEKHNDDAVTVLDDAVKLLKVGLNNEDYQTLTTVELIQSNKIFCAAKRNTELSCEGFTGCFFSLIAEDTKWTIMAQGIQEVQLSNDEYILIVAQHPIACDRLRGFKHCYSALSWDGKVFVSIQEEFLPYIYPN